MELVKPFSLSTKTIPWKLADRVHCGHIQAGEKECGGGHLGKSDVTLDPGREVKEDLTHEDRGDKWPPVDI